MAGEDTLNRGRVLGGESQETPLRAGVGWDTRL